MDYEFGDILDARQIPAYGHFLLVLGETRKNEIMYYLVTSRVYAVFREIISFFDDCLHRNDQHFLKYFKKEKDKLSITPHGNLTDALFLDRHNQYKSSLDVDSMVVLNTDPQLIDKQVLKRFHADNKIDYRDRLCEMDIHRLIGIVRHSKNISPDKLHQINANFKKIRKNKSSP